MADSSVTGLSFFNKTDISIEPAVQQFCQCCQNENIWDCGDSAQNSPAMLACGHSLCFNVSYLLVLMNLSLLNAIGIEVSGVLLCFFFG